MTEVTSTKDNNKNSTSHMKKLLELIKRPFVWDKTD